MDIPNMSWSDHFPRLRKKIFRKNKIKTLDICDLSSRISPLNRCFLSAFRLNTAGLAPPPSPGGYPPTPSPGGGSPRGGAPREGTTQGGVPHRRVSPRKGVPTRGGGAPQGRVVPIRGGCPMEGAPIRGGCPSEGGAPQRGLPPRGGGAPTKWFAPYGACAPGGDAPQTKAHQGYD